MNNETTTEQLLSFLERLSKKSAYSKANVNIEIRCSENGRPVVGITFFRHAYSDSFSVSLYPFYSINKNTKLFNSCIELIDNQSLHEVIKKRIESE